MPQLTIEYSDGLERFDTEACLEEVNRELAGTGHFEEVNIKSRVYQADQVRIGTADAGRGFVAARLGILSGRDLETRRQLSELVIETMAKYIEPKPGIEVQLTVELFEMDRDGFTKRVIRG